MLYGVLLVVVLGIYCGGVFVVVGVGVLLLEMLEWVVVYGGVFREWG